MEKLSSMGNDENSASWRNEERFFVFPLISIIIPVFNGADYLESAIQSALAQSYSSLEVIVVNDGSSDGGATERVASRYNDRIVYLSKPNGGVGSALNLGISVMRGEYFSWLSHDDLYCADKIESQIFALSRLPIEERDRTIIYGDYSVFSSECDRATSVRMRGVSSENFRYWITVENSLHGCTLLIPRAAFVECGVFNERLRTTQDYDLWFRMADKFRFVHVPGAFVYARSHAEQGSVRMAAIAIEECNTLFSGFVGTFSEKELTSASGQIPSVAYAEIAASMLHRGFRRAGVTAARLGWQHVSGRPIREVITFVRTLACGCVSYLARGLARLLLAPQLRLTIRDFFR